MPEPRGRDFELTRKQLAEWIATRLPEARDLNLSSLSGPQATGFSNDTLLFDLDYEQDGRRHRLGLVCRIEPRGFQVFPTYDLALQYRVMQILSRTDVPVPRVYWFEASDEILGAPFYVMERVEGRIPTDNPPYHMGGWMTEIGSQQREAIWWSAVENLARIHRCDWEALGFGFLVPPEFLSDPLHHQLEYYTRYMEWIDQPHPTTAAALTWLREQRPRGEEPLGLCWGDSRIGNMIFRDGRCVAVLDWEMAVLGNPVQDLAWFLYMDRHHSEGVEAPRLEGLPGRDETVTRYAELTGRTVEHLDYYEVFAAFRFAVILTRLGQQMKSLGVLPYESDFPTNNTASRLLAKLLDLPAPDCAE